MIKKLFMNILNYGAELAGPQADKPTSLTGYKLWDIIRIEDTLHHTA